MTDTINHEAIEAFESDTVLRIDDINGFLNALNYCLRKKGNIRPGHRAAKCIHIEQSSHHSKPNNHHPALMKDPSYEYQQEVRVIWEPRKTPIEPIILNCKAASRFCSLLSGEELNKHLK